MEWGGEVRGSDEADRVTREANEGEERIEQE